MYLMYLRTKTCINILQEKQHHHKERWCYAYTCSWGTVMRRSASLAPFHPGTCSQRRNIKLNWTSGSVHYCQKPHPLNCIALIFLPWRCKIEFLLALKVIHTLYIRTVLLLHITCKLLTYCSQMYLIIELPKILYQFRIVADTVAGLFPRAR